MVSYIQIKGKIIGVREVGTGKSKRLVATFTDDSGTIDLVWFKGINWIKSSLPVGEEIVVYGKPTLYGNSWNIPHPEISKKNETSSIHKFQAIYPSNEKLNRNGLNTKNIAKLIEQLLNSLKSIDIPETLPESILNKHHLINRYEAYRKIHLPHSNEEAQKANFRLKFEELFFLQLELLLRKRISLQKIKGLIFKEVGQPFMEFYENHIPFKLTNAQKRVIREIYVDLKSGKHMNRLLQGDVGSGKTLVALLAMLIAVGNHYQAALIAPTEILAVQHFETIRNMLSKMNVSVELLTGSTKKKDRKQLHERLKSGEVNILIGTHAILEDTVEFQNLGLAIIDEQHRFGVAQRAKMRKKNTSTPHILVMTATPIPRTLSMTFYGDLDVSVIDELPPGRKKIITKHIFESQRLTLFSFLRKEIEKGRQVYIVYPLIAESEKLDYNNLMDGFEAISRAFPMPKYQVSIVHGKMRPEDKEFEMNRFIKGETQIMVATTVIEVGVNVPNASVMVIESAERFGLSQLHQLRGRVGRGGEQSYCILITGDEISKDGLKRMQTMVRTNDGFEIAEVDLQLRGPGDIMGTQQSGMLDLKIASLVKDGPIVTLSRDAAKKLLKDDPRLEKPENYPAKKEILKILKEKPGWQGIA